MNVLLIGSAGREHALAHALARSPRLGRLVCAPGNAGIAEVAEIAALDPADHAAVVAYCRAHAIDLVVVGPEGPLVAGLVDALAAAGIRAFGPTREAARLEGSKGYTKELCAERGIPTAGFARFDALEPALAHVRARGAPIVVKHDGLKAGKGVVVAATLAEAEAALAAMLDGTPGESVVIEEFLEGEEASLFALCDGRRAVLLACAQDHKRAFDGDEGPNTGGMGAYSPVPAMTPALEAEVMATIVEPTLAAMRERGAPFVGVLYAGLMLTADGPKLIEYNVRFGDPEAQVLLPRLESDLLEAILAACDGALDRLALRWRSEAALTVVMATRGYPGPVGEGSEIRGVERAAAVPGVTVFHAATRREDGRLLAAGGRVLAVTGLGASLAEARARAYEAAALIDWPEGYRRTDIGRRALAR